MKLKEFENEEEKEFSFSISKKYDTRIELTPRILEVSEAFGLGVSEEKEFIIFDKLNLNLDIGDLIYVTGDSGGGKSTLLNELEARLNGTKIWSSDITPEPDDIIIESIGDDLNEAVKYLSHMGLNDAFIFLRKYKELSDGQKYRYRLAKLLETQADVIFIDEFCANLDRTTAKVIAYNLQKVCRRTGVTLAVATTHEDLIEDFNPDVLVRKHFMNDVEVKYYKPEKKKISFYDDMEVVLTNIGDYRKLSKYHYKNTSDNFPYSKIFSLKYGTDLVGVCVFSPPLLQTKGRTIKFDGKYSIMKTHIVKELNRLFTRVSRIVVSPKYRGCGMGQKLLKEAMQRRTDKKYIELLSVMSNYNPFADKVGMERIEISGETDPPTLRLYDWLEEKGLDSKEIHNPKYWTEFVDNLSDDDKTTLVRMTGKVLHHPKIGLSGKDGKRAEVVKQENIYKEASFNEKRDEIISYIPKLYTGNTLYYIWENPDFKDTTSSLKEFGI